MDESGDFREYVVPLRTRSPLLRLRFDLGLDAGASEIRRVEIEQIELRPIKFGAFSIELGKLRFSLRNLGFDAREVVVSARS